ncbi:aromatic-ring-hydroxylating dioxygenase subunit beta [Ammoniphilus sp. 3BR4]|uniref:aromatic-ring-hydroxylating dioxygenase subunit beta n=1 Tax=Ammoniphilus sp. 3BR4 TaxID=3158265 RepID=UPI0034672FFA
MMNFSREQIEDFLYLEAELLDQARFDEWLELLTEDATYSIPSTDVPDASPRNSLFLVSDDRMRIDSRVKRLKSDDAHVEYPRSRTNRSISNVRIVERSEDSMLVRSNFIVYRMRYGNMDAYVGKYEHRLVERDGQLKIADRKSILDLEALRPHGKVSIIL